MFPAETEQLPFTLQQRNRRDRDDGVSQSQTGNGQISVTKNARDVNARNSNAVVTVTMSDSATEAFNIFTCNKGVKLFIGPGMFGTATIKITTAASRSAGGCLRTK